MGLVIVTGIAIGTLFTLFVVPAMYMMLGAVHEKKEAAEGTPGGTTQSDLP
jgi:multidrug efflux pump